jgi:FkbM family methyltransferase
MKKLLKKLFKGRKNRKRSYTIGTLQISIPPQHNLPDIKSKCKLYDCFLPVLVKNIPQDGLIVDVGANIGDTVAAIAQNCRNQIYCIEPSNIFYKYLTGNVASFPEEIKSRIHTAQELIGTGELSGSLVHKPGGTAGLNPEDYSGSCKSIGLDGILQIEKQKIMLIKSDTDGFDFDVLRSAEKIISRDEPMLFWENEISEDFQIGEFNNLYTFLEKRGYSFIYLFDNYGNLVIEGQNFDTLRHINTYLLSMRKYSCTRTFYYVDVLAVTKKHARHADRAIMEYKNNWIHSLE